jgi:hypothetical protein
MIQRRAPKHSKAPHSEFDQPPPHAKHAHDNTAVVAFLTICWYFSSSKNAIATQQLVQDYLEHFSPASPTRSLDTLHFATMASLTALQLFVGLVIASILARIVAPSTSSTSSCNDRSSKDICCITKNNDTNGMGVFIGCLHYCGCLFTNLGFAYGSASIVQVVKLLEPVETLLLVFIVNGLLAKGCFPILLNGNHGHVTLEKVISVLVIVAGTSLLLLSKEMKVAANIHTILFAVLSGFAMSIRNVAQKTTSGGEPCAKGPKDWRNVMLQGLNNFIRITFRAVIFSFLTLLVSAGFVVNTGNIGMHSLLLTSMGLQSVVFHGLYNMASISVLSLVSAQTHSLLNVVKRISNVIFAAMVFHQPLGARGALGLLIAAIGGIMYSKSGAAAANKQIMQVKDGATTSRSHNSKSSYKQMKAIALVLTMLLVFVLGRLLTPNRKDGERSSQAMIFDPKNPVWPKVPPTIRNDCKVIFRDDRMSNCHILPWKNFGDELGPPVVKRILELHFGCSAKDLKTFNLKELTSVSDLKQQRKNGKKVKEGDHMKALMNRTGSPLDACFMSVGSLWRMVNTGDHLWGTGSAEERTIGDRCLATETEYRPFKVDNVTVYSSRGPLSADKIKSMCSINTASKFDNGVQEDKTEKTVQDAGDAGFLMPFLFPELIQNMDDHHGQKQQQEKKIMCLIPHVTDQQDPKWKWILTHPTAYSIYTLNVGIGWKKMAKNVQTCDAVISTSLHGIIFAEAFGVASRRLRMSKWPGDFKFSDFYMSYRGYEPEFDSDYLEISLSTDGTLSPPLPYQEREAYARKVLKSFPLHLFQIVDAQLEHGEKAEGLLTSVL